MCIGVWSLDHPDYALILCNNRDEYLDRPTQDAHFHSFEDIQAPTPNSGFVLSARDEKAGGTWFGINRAGRVALLTNITESIMEHSSSRGYLVSSFLLSDSSHPLEDEIGKIIPQGAKFAGFNLLLLAPSASSQSGLWSFDSALVTNHGSDGMLTSRPLSSEERSCGAVSNGIDGAGGEDWPKVKHAISDFDAALQNLTREETETELAARLFELLAWQSPQPVLERAHLRNTVHVAPLPITLEGLPTNTSRAYGTRTSTVLLIRRDGRALFIERDIWKNHDGVAIKADPSSQRIFTFQLGLQGDKC